MKRPWLGPLLAACITLALSGLGWAVADRAQFGERVRALEADRENDVHRLERIEQKLDKLLDRH